MPISLFRCFCQSGSWLLSPSHQAATRRAPRKALLSDYRNSRTWCRADRQELYMVRCTSKYVTTPFEKNRSLRIFLLVLAICVFLLTSMNVMLTVNFLQSVAISLGRIEISVKLSLFMIVGLLSCSFLSQVTLVLRLTCRLCQMRKRMRPSSDSSDEWRAVQHKCSATRERDSLCGYPRRSNPSWCLPAICVELQGSLNSR